MEILHTTSVFVLFCIFSILCFPSRPLNERSTELAWQAWLLVDDQNKQHDWEEELPRRRLTPKSVFIAPSFSPDSLTPCADGYQADSMGRCIRIIKLDEEAHLDFLLEKLNAQFGNYDYSDEEFQEDMPTAGPLQLNIPLGNPVEDQSEENMDIAIVVAPTNHDDSGVRTVKKTGPEGQSSGSLAADNFQPNVETTTKTDESMQTTTTENIEGTTETTTIATDAPTTSQNEKTTTLISTTIDATTITEESSTIKDDHALFFREPLANSEHVLLNNGTDNNVQGTPAVTEGDVTTTQVKVNDSLSTFLSNSTTFDANSSNGSHNLNKKQANITESYLSSKQSDQLPSEDGRTVVVFPSKSNDDEQSTDVNSFVQDPNAVKKGETNLETGAGQIGHLQTDSVQQFERLSENTLPNVDSPSKLFNPNLYKNARPNIDYSDLPNRFFPSSQAGYSEGFRPSTGLELLQHLPNSAYSHGSTPNNFNNPEETRYPLFPESHLNNEQRPLFDLPNFPNPALEEHSSRHLFDALFQDYIQKRGADLRENERLIFNNNRERIPEPPIFHETGHERLRPQVEFGPTNEQRVYSHRSREKGRWSIPPTWNESSPLVLTFSGRPSNSRRLIPDRMLPHMQNSEGFYREVPSEEFSHIFGFDRGRRRRIPR